MIQKTSKTESQLDPENYVEFPLVKTNFILMAIAGVAIIVGFLLMLGGSTNATDGFNPDIVSTRRIVIGPAISFLGFLFMAFAIIYRPKTEE